MSSLLDGFVNLGEVPTLSGGLPPTGPYQFVVAEAGIRKNDRFDNWEFYIVYLLNDGKGSDRKWTKQFRLADPGKTFEDMSDSEKSAASQLKTELLNLGLSDQEVANPTSERIEGISGTIVVEHAKGKKDNNRVFVNFRNWKLDEGEPEPEAPVERPAPRARAARKAAPKPEPVVEPDEPDEPEDEDEPEDDEPESETPAVLQPLKGDESDDELAARVRARQAERRRAAASGRDNPLR
jgi:hypothetical protein